MKGTFYRLSRKRDASNRWDEARRFNQFYCFFIFLNVNDKFCATLDQMGKLEFSGGFAKLQLNDPAPGFYLLQLTDSKAGRFTFKFTVN